MNIFSDIRPRVNILSIRRKIDIEREEKKIKIDQISLAFIEKINQKMNNSFSRTNSEPQMYSSKVDRIEITPEKSKNTILSKSFTTSLF